MARNCCLCAHSLIDPSIKKRKKLYGMSCAQSRECLESLVRESTGLLLGSFLETQADALLCHLCDGKLDKLCNIKAEISRNISALHLDPRLSGQPLPGRKRSNAGGSTSHAKQARIDAVEQHDEQQPTVRQVALQSSPIQQLDLPLPTSQQQECPLQLSRHQDLQESSTSLNPEQCFYLSAQTKVKTSIPAFP